MTLLPIVERELRVRVRRRTGHWLRFGIALGALLACLPQLLVPGAFGPVGSSFGSGVFNGLVGAGFLLSCSACFFTANAVASEQQEGTLGLLFLTRVNTLDVLLGKFGSVGLTSLCSLLAFVPMMLIPILAGGVTGGEAARKGLALLATLSLALAIGLWAAVASVRVGTMRSAFGAILLVVVLPFVLWHFGSSSWRGFGLMSPLVCVVAAGDIPYKTGPLWFWGSAFGVLVLAALALLGAALRLRRVAFWEAEPVVAQPAVAQPEQAAGSGAASAAGSRWGPQSDKSSPVTWLVRRQPGIQAQLWAAALLSLCYQLAWLFIPRAMMTLGGTRTLWTFLWLPGLVVSGLTSGLIAWAASRFFIEGRRSAQLEVLFTTPLGAWTVVNDQWKALCRLMRGPIVVMLLPWLFHLVTMFSILPGFPGNMLPDSWRLQQMVSLLISSVGLVLHIAALCWVSLWFGFKARSQAGAIVWSVCLATTGPSLLSSVLMALLNGLLSRFLGGFTAWHYFLSWFTQIAVLLAELGLLWWARGRLRSELGGGRFTVRQSMATAARATADALGRARHWTPS